MKVDGVFSKILEEVKEVHEEESKVLEEVNEILREVSKVHGE
jgi:tRNA nucleotidyltransferase (CCA-adding enzyme)